MVMALLLPFVSLVYFCQMRGDPAYQIRKNRKMKIKFWGVRGSIPSSMMTEQWAQHFKNLMVEFFYAGNTAASQIDAFLGTKSLPQIGGYGTGTTCVEVSDSGKSLIIDCGSGLKNLNDSLVQSGAIKTQNEYHILMSHFHLDHIMGMPFFTPHFFKGKTIHYYSVQKETESIVRQMFAKPTFPITFESLQANIKFHTIRPYEKITIQDFDVTAYQLDHPDPCYGFRVEKNAKAYAHAIDHEAIRTSMAQLGLDGGLFKNIQLLYFDAQYTESQMTQKQGWGHGTCDRGFQVAANFGVEQILFAHHDPSADLQAIDQQKKDAQVILQEKFPELVKAKSFKWDYAFEGQAVEI